MAITNEERLADMVQCLFCDILEEPGERPRDFEESLRLLSVLKRRGLEKRLEAACKIERLDKALPLAWEMITEDRPIAIAITNQRIGRTLSKNCKDAAQLRSDIHVIFQHITGEIL